MFTGLIEELGEITAVEAAGDGIRITVRAPLAVSDAEHGDSIAISGVCLTVVATGADWFSADVMAATVAGTTIGSRTPGDAVNVERAMRADDRLGGHVVQGHVDGFARVLEVRPGEAWQVVRIALPDDLAPLVARKGSITVDGISLTVSDVGPDWFEVSLIPETLRATTMGRLQPGDVVNLETDILARHVARLAEFGFGIGARS
jgi:riboflavin synthase